jgi:hypothetical protein
MGVAGFSSFIFFGPNKAMGENVFGGYPYIYIYGYPFY